MPGFHLGQQSDRLYPRCIGSGQDREELHGTIEAAGLALRCFRNAGRMHDDPGVQGGQRAATGSGMQALQACSRGVGVEFVEMASQKTVYRAEVVANHYGERNRGSMMLSFDGRVDNTMYNLATFLQQRLAP
jgi:hypothetical protein